LDRPNLFEKYPNLEYSVPWISMGTFPTPVEKMSGLEEKTGHSNLWIKRDDLSSDKMGGNKVRIMEFLLALAKAQGKERVVSSGALGSNQIMASAIYAKDLDIKVTGVFFKQCDTDYMCKHMLIDYSMDVEFNHVGNPYMMPLAILYHCVRNINWKNMELPFYIPTFGSSATCVLGYVNAMFELKKQIDAGEIPEPDYIFITVGTGGTMAGIELGARLTGLDTKVIGVRIADWITSNEAVVASAVNRCIKLLKKAGAMIPPLKYSASDITIIHEFFGGEYAMITDESIDAKELALETDDIVLDTTYTAKTMAAMLKYLGGHKMSDKNILFWHTYNTKDLGPFLREDACCESLPKEFHCYFKED
jgi:1-aminocyclopropane-1-carboxylate deaminase/D-cysteine desulfhydrase-like pyridoxal-dependent ACC family enzyme